MSFSIIVPVYNVEEYIEECIKSVITQNYRDIELILVNDGSPDKSGDICDLYATKDSRIKVVHKENGGLSDARNAGIKVATKENILFLDSDDFLNSNILGNLNDVISENSDFDLITCTRNTVDSNEKIRQIPMEMKPIHKKVNRGRLYKELSQSSSIYWSAWSNVFKRDKILENNLHFRDGLIGAEDCEFYMNYVRQSSNFIFSDYPLVNYRVEREGSITDEMSKDAVMGQLKVFSENYYFYEYKNEDLKKYFANKFANTVFLLSKLRSVEEVNICASFIERNKRILKDTQGSKYYFSKLLWNFSGYYNGSALLSKVKAILGS